MSYNISKSDGTPITIADSAENNVFSITLYGKDATPYGSGVAQSLVRMLENFSGTTPPRGAIKGQLWYDTQASILKIWQGSDPTNANDQSSADRANSNWKPVGGAVVQDLLPEVDNTINIGADGFRYKSVFAYDIDAKSGTFNKCTSGDGYAIKSIGNIRLQGSIYPSLPAAGQNTCSAITSVNLGSSNNKFSTSHVINSYIYNSINLVNESASKTVTLNLGSNYELYPSGVMTLGSLSNKITKVFVKETDTEIFTLGTNVSQGIGSNILPVFDNTYDIGAPGRRFKSVSAVTLNGALAASNIVGLVPQAGKWAAPITLSLTGGVTGSVSIDGSSSVSISATVPPTGHQHEISQVTGLQAALDSKLNAGSTALNAQLLGNQPPSFYTLPTGSVIMWYGNINAIPATFVLANGVGTLSNGTPVPNLMDRMIIGAGNQYAVGATGGSSTHIHNVVVQDTILSIDQMPAHSHTVHYGYWTPGSIDTTGWQGEPVNPLNAPEGQSRLSSTVGGGQPHTHGANSNAASNLPPFFALVPIIKY